MLLTPEHAAGERAGPSHNSRTPLKGVRIAIDAISIGTYYATTYGTLWKDGTYFPRGTRVLVVGMHLDQGFCVRFPADVDGEPLETWEDWSESEFLAEDGTVERPGEVSAAVLAEAREVLDDAEDGCHLHLHETSE